MTSIGQSYSSVFLDSPADPYLGFTPQNLGICLGQSSTQTEPIYFKKPKETISSDAWAKPDVHFDPSQIDPKIREIDTWGQGHTGSSTSSIGMTSSNPVSSATSTMIGGGGSSTISSDTNYTDRPQPMSSTRESDIFMRRETSRPTTFGSTTSLVAAASADYQGATFLRDSIVDRPSSRHDKLQPHTVYPAIESPVHFKDMPWLTDGASSTSTIVAKPNNYHQQQMKNINERGQQQWGVTVVSWY